MIQAPISILWLRRDLRLEDNRALDAAVRSGLPILLLFIFDPQILSELPADDSRITFIHQSLRKLHDDLRSKGSALMIRQGNPREVWEQLLEEFTIAGVFANRDYEPYAVERDKAVARVLNASGVPISFTKDQVIFDREEVIKADGTPYTVFTPYKKRWLEKYKQIASEIHKNYGPPAFIEASWSFPEIEALGFRPSAISAPPPNLTNIRAYEQYRDVPALGATTLVGPHLRFGTISIRELARQAEQESPVFLSELIWREFFMQILHHYPALVTQSFKKVYDSIQWRNHEADFQRWCRGETGYPLVDAGMRQLNQTGFMHNRIRMVVASFLCKHLLIHWSWGEAYFADKLLDYELSSNNGNWQWAAGTGCDAAPYFRVFNPSLQQQRFDPNLEYIRQWIPDYDPQRYIPPMVDHAMARVRAIQTYRAALSS
ncbi:MAG: DNA photolyase family protein [Bacteroidales bacterium]|jgi:deoxyribodipyrimidine photo-lyase|nr:DNA photolyase family protein [Bacteroidales bacterium]MDD2570594.1 deoxyribodipyrimidine photo-lyase [Bacteroidales bacterium]MDD2813106.1 deoxyribodipyrimidine photo-lyase [Bacteroidales bacterium]MDD3385628.1 deoxyribodipyrimidine photo-lyase [Bacteroidales bacterium]MDD3811526.1 deoxyribodipyrimidine photo-lyase [Bacteroidales bacterium]